MSDLLMAAQQLARLGRFTEAVEAFQVASDAFELEGAPVHARRARNEARTMVVVAWARERWGAMSVLTVMPRTHMPDAREARSFVVHLELPVPYSGRRRGSRTLPPTYAAYHTTVTVDNAWRVKAASGPANEFVVWPGYW